eukprot:gnl/TRDRNA2_/TRDRNA2_53579_c0_seq1.p1 gnl/TRDRNA2_/TRDRNA2_53579_c0~~gnl/TRDRNA2_/TRDRNA2_53579_c0_seq1.p1  ORF type:complete len:594 (-),score=95.99 gnl/TRDRNA2_/TRDRNA2_53579_c0_seq1:49-1830(-)
MSSMCVIDAPVGAPAASTTHMDTLSRDGDDSDCDDAGAVVAEGCRTSTDCDNPNVVAAETCLDALVEGTPPEVAAALEAAAHARQVSNGLVPEVVVEGLEKCIHRLLGANLRLRASHRQMQKVVVQSKQALVRSNRERAKIAHQLALALGTATSKVVESADEWKSTSSTASGASCSGRSQDDVSGATDLDGPSPVEQRLRPVRPPQVPPLDLSPAKMLRLEAEVPALPSFRPPQECKKDAPQEKSAEPKSSPGQHEEKISSPSSEDLSSCRTNSSSEVETCMGDGVTALSSAVSSKGILASCIHDGTAVSASSAPSVVALSAASDCPASATSSLVASTAATGSACRGRLEEPEATTERTVEARLFRPLLARLVAVMQGRRPPQLAAGAGSYDPLQNLIHLLESRKLSHMSEGQVRGVLRVLGVLTSSSPDADTLSFKSNIHEEHGAVMLMYDLVAWCGGPKASSALWRRRMPQLRRFLEPGRVCHAASGASDDCEERVDAARQQIKLIMGHEHDHPDLAGLRQVVQRCARRGAAYCEVSGTIRLVYASTPCLASVAGLCQFGASFPTVRMEVAFGEALASRCIPEANRADESM